MKCVTLHIGEALLSFPWSVSIAGFIGGLALSAGMIRLAARIGWVDHPDHGRKWHQRPMPLTGGLVLWLILILGQLTGLIVLPLQPIDWVGIHLMALMGALDDRLNLRARYKAIAGLSVAFLLATQAALMLAQTVDHVDFFWLQIPTHSAMTFPFLLFWFWSIPQAFNLIDGINGLSMGIALLLFGILGAHMGTQPALLMGALLAVFLLNFPRARHFLGDCGALMLGTLFAILSARLLVKLDATLPIWVFAYPIMDVTLVVAIRFANGQPLGQADRNHLHHWMLDKFRGRCWLITPILLVVAFLPMLRASDLPGAKALSLAGIFALLGLGLKAFLDRIQPEPNTGHVPMGHIARLPRDVPFLPNKPRTESQSGRQAS